MNSTNSLPKKWKMESYRHLGWTVIPRSFFAQADHFEHRRRHATTSSLPWVPPPPTDHLLPPLSAVAAKRPPPPSFECHRGVLKGGGGWVAATTLEVVVVCSTEKEEIKHDGGLDYVNPPILNDIKSPSSTVWARDSWHHHTGTPTIALVRHL